MNVGERYNAAALDIQIDPQCCCLAALSKSSETAVSALSSMQDNTVRVADAMHHLAVQGTVQPVAGKGTAQHWTVGLAVVVSGGLGILMSTGFRLPGTSRRWQL